MSFSILTELILWRAPNKFCTGTNNGLSMAMSVSERYRRLSSNFGDGCTHIDGNLEIVGLMDPSVDLSFLESIQEVSGYLLIAMNYVPSIPLTSLRVIRGQKPYYGHTTLGVMLNFDTETQGVGLTELNFPSLLEIVNGNVNITGNRDLCHVNTIVWSDIIDSTSQEVVIMETPESCDECASNCEEHCWTPNVCQLLTKTICHSKCDNRCFSSKKRDCCHPNCIAGCTGPSNSDCLACKDFELDGDCVEECPPKYVYDETVFVNTVNADGRVVYQSTCVTACPAHLVEDNGQCISTCPSGKIVVEGACHTCDGECPHVCRGFSNEDDEYVNELNIKSFQNCTIIDGSIIILEATFDGDLFMGVTGIRPADLEVFNTVVEITGHLTVLHDGPGMEDLSYFRNLEVIRGRELYNGRVALTVLDTRLKSISLSALREVSNGDIYVKENKNMCYTSKQLFSTLVVDPERQTVYVGKNKPRDACRKDDKVCHSECNDAVCWGPGATNCLECKNFDLEGVCVKECDQKDGFYSSSSNKCGHCHEECVVECSGPGADECAACKNVIDEGHCRKECPSMKYVNPETMCRPCHKFCAGGCTGPSNLREDGGCNACVKPRFHADGTVECIDPDTPAFICSENEGDCLEQCVAVVENRDEEIIQLYENIAQLQEEVIHLKEVLKYHYEVTHGRLPGPNDLKAGPDRKY
ncbi:epidermal growth factor receptor-like [Glandiceps talaboti]